jgi:hypothetical protein
MSIWSFTERKCDLLSGDLGLIVTYIFTLANVLPWCF